jgi:hypothetical protein
MAGGPPEERPAPLGRLLPVVGLVLPTDGSLLVGIFYNIIFIQLQPNIKMKYEDNKC